MVRYIRRKQIIRLIDGKSNAKTSVRKIPDEAILKQK